MKCGDVLLMRIRQKIFIQIACHNSPSHAVDHFNVTPVSFSTVNVYSRICGLGSGCRCFFNG